MSKSNRLGLGLTVDGWPNPGPYPDWLPTAPSGDRPVIFVDFVNGHYWASGSIVTPDQILVHDSDWGSYDPAAITPGSGLAATNQNPVISAAYTPPLLPALTVIMTTQQASGTGPAFCQTAVHVLDLPNEITDYGITVDVSTTTNSTAIANVINQTDFQNTSSDEAPAGMARMAGSLVTSSGGGVKYALNGVRGPDNDQTVIPDPTPTNIAFSATEGGSGVGWLLDVTVYMSQPDADLDALSAL